MFTWFYQVGPVLLGFSASFEFDKVSSGCTGFYFVLLGITRFYRVFFQGFTGFSEALPGFNWFLLGFYLLYLVLPKPGLELTRKRQTVFFNFVVEKLGKIFCFITKMGKVDNKTG